MICKSKQLLACDRPFSLLLSKIFVNRFCFTNLNPVIYMIHLWSTKWLWLCGHNCTENLIKYLMLLALIFLWFKQSVWVPKLVFQHQKSHESVWVPKLVYQHQKSHGHATDRNMIQKLCNNNTAAKIMITIASSVITSTRMTKII